MRVVLTLMAILLFLGDAFWRRAGMAEARPLARRSETRVTAVNREPGPEAIATVLRERLRNASAASTRALAQRIVQLGANLKLSSAMVLSLIQTESAFNAHVVSKRGAIGLMQLRPDTARFIAQRAGIEEYHRKSDLLDPVVNVTLGMHYLAYLRTRFSDMRAVLAAYNLGPNRMERIGRRRLVRYHGVRRYVAQIHGGMAAFTM